MASLYSKWVSNHHYSNNCKIKSDNHNRSKIPQNNNAIKRHQGQKKRWLRRYQIYIWIIQGKYHIKLMGYCKYIHLQCLNTLKLKQNGHNFTDNIFKSISLDENFLILNTISLKYVPYGLIDNMAALVQIMAWHRTGHKPLIEPMLVCCTDAYMLHSASMS